LSNGTTTSLCSTFSRWRNWFGHRLGRFFQSNRLHNDLAFCVFELDDREIFNSAFLDFLQSKVIYIELVAGGGESSWGMGRRRAIQTIGQVTNINILFEERILD